MLMIVGQPVTKASYTRVPMEDSAGPVSAFIYDTHVDYYPKDGSEDVRVARAQILANETGGVHIKPTGRRPFARVAFEKAA